MVKKNKLHISTLIIISLLMFNFYSIFASSNVLKIEMSEKVYENISYNSLTGETENSYNILGEILIINSHPTESIENIKLNFTEISKIYNLSYSSGNLGYIEDFNGPGNNAQLFIPDLGPSKNTTFTYNINTTNITSPLNFDTNYSEFSIFAGSTFNVSDKITNTLNASEYADNCIYNISIKQNALQIAQTTPVNFTFIGPITGTDSGNTVLSGNNRDIDWAVLNNNCLIEIL